MEYLKISYANENDVIPPFCWNRFQPSSGNYANYPFFIDSSPYLINYEICKKIQSIIKAKNIFFSWRKEKVRRGAVMGSISKLLIFFKLEENENLGWRWRQWRQLSESLFGFTLLLFHFCIIAWHQVRNRHQMYDRPRQLGE